MPGCDAARAAPAREADQDRGFCPGGLRSDSRSLQLARVWGQGGPTVEVGASALRCHPRGQQEGRGATPTKAPLTPPTRGPASARRAPSGHRWQPRHARLCSVTARGVPGRWQVSRVAEPLAEHTGPTEKPVTPFQLLPLDQGPSDPSALSRRGVPGKPRGLQASSGSALPRVQPLSISAPGEGRSLREDLGVAPSAGAGQTAGLTHTAPSRGIASSLFRASGLQPQLGAPQVYPSAAMQVSRTPQRRHGESLCHTLSLPTLLCSLPSGPEGGHRVIRLLVAEQVPGPEKKLGPIQPGGCDEARRRGGGRWHSGDRTDGGQPGRPCGGSPGPHAEVGGWGGSLARPPRDRFSAHTNRRGFSCSA